MWFGFEHHSFSKKFLQHSHRFFNICKLYMTSENTQYSLCMLCTFSFNGSLSLDDLCNLRLSAASARVARADRFFMVMRCSARCALNISRTRPLGCTIVTCIANHEELFKCMFLINIDMLFRLENHLIVFQIGPAYDFMHGIATFTYCTGHLIWRIENVAEI